MRIKLFYLQKLNMLNLITRKASLVLVFGIFFITSCSSLNKTESASNKQQASGPLAEIESINMLIEQDGHDEALLLRKAELFIEAAQSESLPSSRKPLYRNARNTSIDGITRFSGNTQEFNRILNDAWSFEHNSGVRLLQARGEESSTERSLNKAIEHLENAIIIQPDSLSSYNVLSTAYYSNGLYTNAEETLNRLLEVSSDPDRVTATNEKLAFIYLESGEPGKSVSKYQELLKENSTSITIRHGLINAYILNNQPDKAAKQLQTLTDEYPDRITYLESLASVRYQMFETGVDSLLKHNGDAANIDMVLENLLSQINEITVIYDNLSENSLMDEESIYNAAGYHMNGAAYLKDLKNNVELRGSNSDLIDDTEVELLGISLSYWEQLVDLNPDNIEYLYTLYTLYNRLEMFEEAESLEQSHNF